METCERVDIVPFVEAADYTFILGQWAVVAEYSMLCDCDGDGNWRRELRYERCQLTIGHGTGTRVESNVGLSVQRRQTIPNCDPCTNGGSSDGDMDDDNIPDEDDSDMDGDGIGNNHDDDMDGDGIPNDSDPDNDNDGIPNDQDDTPHGPDVSDDIDGDGIPNDQDDDIDNDGIPNDEDSDMDGDGVDNDEDLDDDDDGILDEDEDDGGLHPLLQWILNLIRLLFNLV